MNVAVKICGLTSAGAADAAARLGAEYGGLVFHPASPRNLSLEQAKALSEAMRGKLKRVALVADRSDEDLQAIITATSPEFLQLHGNESVARTAEIRARFQVPVIKALAVADTQDLKGVNDYAPVADMLLFDAKPPKGAQRGGGHGVAFDWQMLDGRGFSKPWFLAGGLNPANVARAIAASGAAMVDVSSGVESAPGTKSESLMAQFVAAAKEKVRA